MTQVVDVDRLDQPPFTLNRNMESRYGFHQFGIHNARTKKALKESVTVHPLSVHSSDQWDGKLYHGTQSENFCDPSVQIIGSNPALVNAFASDMPTGFYTDLDPLGAPIVFATRKWWSNLPSYIVELHENASITWDQPKPQKPGWIVFLGTRSEGIRVNKIYRLSPRVRICIDIFKKQKI